MSAGTVEGRERRNKADIKIAAIFIYSLSKLVDTWAVTECTRELGGGCVVVVPVHFDHAAAT